MSFRTLSQNFTRFQKHVSSLLYGHVTDDISAQIRLDRITHALKVIEYEHSEIHNGDYYFYKTWADIDGAGTVAYFMFVTPDTTTQIHAKALVFGEAEFTLDICEGATVSANGTQLVGRNCYRDSINQPELTLYSGPTVTDIGTIIWSGKTGSGRSQAGVAPGLNYEIIAKRNTKYLWRITKVPAGIHYVDADFFWYEHAPKD